MNLKRILLILLNLAILTSAVQADYDQEIKDQISKIVKDYPQPKPEYFRDAGILVRKADDAALYDLTADMVRNLLLDKMKEYVKTELDQINALYEKDAFQANRRLQDLIRFERYYKPSEEFMRTAAGQALVSEMVQTRSNGLGSLERGCLDFGLIDGINAIRSTGLFIVNNTPEIESLRALDKAVGCCMGWKPEIRFSREQEFKTDYDEGTKGEEAVLRLESSRADLSQARWGGDFIYNYKGREGQGKATSKGILVVHRGKDEASLAISTSRLTSTGRMNFPNALTGENRTVEIQGKPVNPALVYEEELIPLTGCYDK